ncbi:MAG: ATP-grasp domain-containing protein [Alphaproteobacteria bacterium]|nr:ATP-grasp domain-containing protein [Alphaproteobacteria bacterium]
MRRLRVMVLHSDVAPDAPPDELDTLYQADAIATALREREHMVRMAAFHPDEDELRKTLGAFSPDIVYNLVEAIEGSGKRAVGVPDMLDRLGVKFTGASTAALEIAGDKPEAKRRMREAGLPTPDWSEPPDWRDIREDRALIVKSSVEDCSLGLDDDSIVFGRHAVRERAAKCAARFGGRWFAEEFVQGREFNVAVLDDSPAPLVLPLAEMTFQEWDEKRPRIVGYRAKWADDSFESTRTVRSFGLEEQDAALADRIRWLAQEAWRLFGVLGYARVDLRVAPSGDPTILEINPNPCLSPDAGFAAAAELAGMPYPILVERILLRALA